MPYSVAMLSIHTSPLDMPGRTKDAGGMNVYIRELARELGSRQVHVDIFTRWTEQDSPQIVQLDHNVRVIHIKAGPRAALDKQDLPHYLSTFARNIDAFRSAEAGQYDILHSHYWLSGVAALDLARRWDVPHVAMFHTLGRLKQLANPDAPEPALRLEMERHLLQQADRIIAFTADERARMIRYCAAPPGQIDAIPCGVDLQHFVPQDRQQARQSLGLPLQQPVVLFAGRLDPFKGPDLLLRAAAMMREEVQVVIAGGRLSGDKDMQQLRKLAATLNISQRVHFLGARPQREMPLVYSAADVTVMPSYNESFGLAAAESLACGTPVVATRVGGLTSIVRHGETGYLVPRCPNFFAERLDTLLRRPDLIDGMRQAARPSVLGFSWKNVANQVYTVYHDLINESECLLAQ